MSKSVCSAAAATAGLAILACSTVPAWAGVTSFSAAVVVETRSQAAGDADTDSTSAFGSIGLAADAREPYIEQNPAFSPTAFIARSTATGTASVDRISLDFATSSGRDAPNGFSFADSGFYAGGVGLNATIDVAEPTPFTLTAPTFEINGVAETLDAGRIRLVAGSQTPLIDATAGLSPNAFYLANVPPGQNPFLTTANGVLQPGRYTLSLEFRTSAESGGSGSFSGFTFAIPEPATAMLLLPAGLALLARRRRA